MSEASVRAEIIRTLYRHTLSVLLTNVVNAAIVGVTLWYTASHRLVLEWMVLVAVVVVARWVLHRRFRMATTPLANVGVWGRRFALGAGASGILWGCAGFFLLEQANPLSQLLVTFVIGGMCAAAAGTTACYLPAFFAFVLPALAALAFRMSLYRDPTHIAMTMMIAIYAIALSVVARVNCRVLTEAFTLRFENERLLERLSAAQGALEENNRTLERRVADRTETLRLQRETLRDAQRMEAVGRLAGGIAHDFNNLLTVIIANLSDLGKGRSLDHDARMVIDEMRDAASKGADLVRQLLMFSRRQRTCPELLDLNAVVKGMERLLSRLVGERITLQLGLQEVPLLVRVDPTQIEQVVVNLVTNARDAMGSGGVVTIETRAVHVLEPTDGMDVGRYGLLCVSDTGSGMDSETRQRVFDPFFTTKDVGKGTGLGLATVYGIVEHGGGHVRVTSQVNQGSAFRVYLPLAVSESCQASDTAPIEAGKTTSLHVPPDLSAVTVLLVEDEPTVRNVARRVMRREGFQVLAAESGARALEISKEHAGEIELLVTDVIMPDMGGPALAVQLRALRPMIRTLFISGYSRDEAIPPDDPAGGCMFLSKPFTNDGLVGKLRELLVAASREAPSPRGESS